MQREDVCLIYCHCANETHVQLRSDKFRKALFFAGFAPASRYEIETPWESVPMPLESRFPSLL